VAGAFHGLEQLIERRMSSTRMGFGAALHTRNDTPVGEVLTYVHPEDLLHFGLIPELVGRLPIVATLEARTEDDLMRILTGLDHGVGHPKPLLSQVEAPPSLQTGDFGGYAHSAAWLKVADAVIEAQESFSSRRNDTMCLTLSTTALGRRCWL
jgi:hypothetical protein